MSDKKWYEESWSSLIHSRTWILGKEEITRFSLSTQIIDVKFYEGLITNEHMSTISCILLYFKKSAGADGLSTV